LFSLSSGGAVNLRRHQSANLHVIVAVAESIPRLDDPSTRSRRNWVFCVTTDHCLILPRLSARTSQSVAGAGGRHIDDVSNRNHSRDAKTRMLWTNKINARRRRRYPCYLLYFRRRDCLHV